MNKVFEYTTEIALAYGVLEPLHFSCKIDTKTAKALPFQFWRPLTMPCTSLLGTDKMVYMQNKYKHDFFKKKTLRVYSSLRNEVRSCQPVYMRQGSDSGIQLWGLRREMFSKHTPIAFKVLCKCMLRKELIID